MKNKIIGLLILILAEIGFVFSLFYFKLDGVKVEFSNIPLLFKIILTLFIPLIGLYFGLIFIASKKIANQIGIAFASTIILSIVLGVFCDYFHLTRKFLGIVVLIPLIFFAGYYSKEPPSIKDGIKVVLKFFAFFAVIIIVVVLFQLLLG